MVLHEILVQVLETMEIIKSIIRNILVALYQPFWYALLLSTIFMFVWHDYKSIKDAARKWIYYFKNSERFRKMFFLVFYSVMILFRTLLNRDMWMNPVLNVLGTWSLYTEKNGEMVLTTEVPENLALFIPFTILLLWAYRDKILNKISLSNVLLQSIKIVFIFSFMIEMLQLFLRLGTWQLSDLFFNTLGGFIGGLIYWLGYKVKHRGSEL